MMAVIPKNTGTILKVIIWTMKATLDLGFNTAKHLAVAPTRSANAACGRIRRYHERCVKHCASVIYDMIIYPTMAITAIENDGT
jgi:hypothetical protein